MDFVAAIKHGFRNYVTFSGRAARSEFWYWTLFAVLLSIAAGILDRAFFASSDVSPLNMIAGLVTLLPGLAVSVRRLHDIDRSGWWVWIALTIIGIFVLIYWDCKKGTAGPNRFGPDPLATV